MKNLFSAFVVLYACVVSVLAEDQILFDYQPVITAKDRVNSNGDVLKDPVKILIQERANSHKAKEAFEDYFTTPQKRAEIPEMIARGEFTDEIKDVVLNYKEPVLYITVSRQKSGKLAMNVGMRIRDQDNYEEVKEIIDDELNPVQLRESLLIKKDNPEYNLIVDDVQKFASVMVEEEVTISVHGIYISGMWARVDSGLISNKKEGDVINEKTSDYFLMPHTSLVKKWNGRWRVMAHKAAGDTYADTVFPEMFPEAPKVLFPADRPLGNDLIED